MSRSLVFIHGLGLGEWIFEKYFTPHYRGRNYDTHTFDLPGHTRGFPESDRQRVTLEECVDFVERYLDRNVSGPYVIIAMSMGSAICQKLMEKGCTYDGLLGMVWLSPVPPINNLVFTLRMCQRLAATEPQVLVDFFAGKANPKLIFSPETLSRCRDEEIEGLVSNTLHGFTRLEYSLFFQDLLSQPLSCEIPLKIIGGKDDMLFSPEVLDFTASYYSRRAEILPGLGHMIPVEPNYTLAVDTIDSFLNGVFE